MGKWAGQVARLKDNRWTGRKLGRGRMKDAE